MGKFPNNIQYLFCPNVPWMVDDGIVFPFLSKEIFKRVKDKAKNFYAICPGYLLESLITFRANDIFINADIKINWIMPNVYSEALSIFDFKYKGIIGNIFGEYDRLRKAVDAYPTPIFMDEDDNVYFNLLCNYGKRVNCKNNPAPDNEEPFWKQILKNTLMFDNYRFKKFDIDLYDRCKTFLNYYGVDFNKRFILIDNSNIFGIPAHGFKINSTFMFPEQARNIAGYLHHKGIQCVIMTNDKKKYYGKNLFVIDTWNKLRMIDLLALLNNTHGVVASDPNIFLSAPIMGCKNVVCNDTPKKGWTLKDLDGFCEFDGNCIHDFNINADDIISFFI